MLQDQAQCILGDYVRTRYPRQPTRFGRLLLLVPSLRAIRSMTVELLFFKETIGDIPITQLLGDMYYMEKCAPNAWTAKLEHYAMLLEFPIVDDECDFINGAFVLKFIMIKNYPYDRLV